MTTSDKSSRLALTVFTESRFARDTAGNWESDDTTQGPKSWEWYACAFGRARIAGRCHISPRTISHGQIRGVALVPLPYYHGAAGLLRVMPKLIIRVWRATRQPLCLVRLPGVIGLSAAVSCIIRRRPYAAEVVGDVGQVLSAGTLGFVGRLFRPFVVFLFRLAVRHASAVRYVTEATLQREYPPSHSAHVIAYSDVNIRAVDYAIAPRRLSNAPYEIIAVGSMEQLYKGHDTAIEALAALRQERPELDARLTIVGDGKYRSQLANLAANLGLAPWVRFTGWISDRASLFELFDRTQVFVMPSRTEGLPRALIEAMARGLPAIASNRGGIPELLPVARLIPADDPEALARQLRLLSDPIAYQSASEGALRMARRFSDDHVAARADQWRRVLHDLGYADSTSGRWGCR